MQEDIEQRSVTLIISTAKLTGRALKAAIAKFLAYPIIDRKSVV